MNEKENIDNLSKEETNSLKEYFKNYESDIIKKHKTVTSEEYQDWLIKFTEKTLNKHWADDYFLYSDDIDEKEKEKIQLLSYFYSYVASEKEKQNVVFSLSDISRKDDFYDEILIFKLKNNYYKLFLAVGQGAFTAIEKLDKKPKRFIYINETIPETEKAMNKYIEYVIINNEIKFENTELLDYISSLSNIVSIEERQKEEYKYWYKQSLQEREFIYLSSKEIQKLSDNAYYLNFRETKDIAVLSLGIKTKYENEKMLKNLKEDL